MRPMKTVTATNGTVFRLLKTKMREKRTDPFYRSAMKKNIAEALQTWGIVLVRSCPCCALKGYTVFGNKCISIGCMRFSRAETTKLRKWALSK